ncbi:MAG TPA: hypothetical protein VF128_08715 [Gemmatimonadaceae bacterium]
MPKTDLMAQQLPLWKPTIVPDYQLDTVRQALGSMARITHEEVVTTSGRTRFAHSRT